MRSSSIFAIAIASYFFNFSLAVTTQEKSNVMGGSQQKGKPSEIGRNMGDYNMGDHNMGDRNMGDLSMGNGLLSSLLGGDGARKHMGSAGLPRKHRSGKKNKKNGGGLLDGLLGGPMGGRKKAGRKNGGGITDGLLGRSVSTDRDIYGGSPSVNKFSRRRLAKQVAF